MDCNRKKVWVVFGTRPEAIKMCPLVKELQAHSSFEVSVCVTAQHRDMLDQVLSVFDVIPDFDLDLMRHNQGLPELTSRIIEGMSELLSEHKPDMVLVHGDTTTTFAVSLACYYQQISVGHVEAGLRTSDVYSPWPEEGNRQLTKVLSSWHFAPTESAKENLLKENTSESKIVITGNTVIDALKWVVEKNLLDENFIEEMGQEFPFINENDKVLLVTGHRRENHGQGFEDICSAIYQLANENPTLKIAYPVHPNPNVSAPVIKALSGLSNVYLIKPQEYRKFVYLMQKSYIILTDSGGIQEEAPSIGKPVLVMRETTERPEAVTSGTVRLVGSDKDVIVNAVNELLSSQEAYNAMSGSKNPYGDGTASKQIVDFISKQIL
jgi:UDP-N-acetylglucosamine 2-epimerase (non-hydrolysing)